MLRIPTASPAGRPATVRPDGEAFHRLGRVPGERGWRPTAVGALTAGLFVISLVVIIAVLAVVEAVVPQSLPPSLWTMDMADPYAFLLGFAVIAWMLPCALVARRLVGPAPVGLLSSVAGRLRWGWLGRCLVISGTIYVAGFAIGVVVVDPLLGVPLTPPTPVPAALVFVAAAVVLVPLQAAAEEYVFRGVSMHLVGGWLRHPAFAVLVPVPLFVLGHGYDPLGQISVGGFAILAGWVTWRTGGLEAAIAMHVVNNSLLTVMQSVGWSDPNATDLPVSALVLSIVVQLVTTGLIVRTADVRGIRRVAVAVPVGGGSAAGASTTDQDLVAG